MISVKARWERWCRWNCDLRVINVRKKAFSVGPKASPRCPNHVTICLHHYITLGSRCKMANLSSEDKTDTLPAGPTRIQPYQFEPARQDFQRVPVFHGVCEITLTEVLATQMGMMRHSKKDCLNCINLIHFHLTVGRLHGSSCIVIPGVVCEMLQFMATHSRPA